MAKSNEIKQKNSKRMLRFPLQFLEIQISSPILKERLQKYYEIMYVQIKNLQEIVATSPVHDNIIITSRQPQGEIAKILQNYVRANKNESNN